MENKTDAWTGEVIENGIPYLSISNPYFHKVSNRLFETVPDIYCFTDGVNAGKWLDMQMADLMDKFSQDNYS